MAHNMQRTCSEWHKSRVRSMGKHTSLHWLLARMVTDATSFVKKDLQH